MLGMAPRQAAAHRLFSSASFALQAMATKTGDLQSSCCSSGTRCVSAINLEHASWLPWRSVAHPLPVVLHDCLMGSDSSWMAPQGRDATGAWTAAQIKAGRTTLVASSVDRLSQQLRIAWTCSQTDCTITSLLKHFIMCSRPALDSPRLRPSRAVVGRSVAADSAAWAGALSSSASKAPGWGGGADVLTGGWGGRANCWQGCAHPRGSAVGGCWHRRSNAPAHGALTRGAAAAASLWEVCSANAKFQHQTSSLGNSHSTGTCCWPCLTTDSNYRAGTTALPGSPVA